jgi:predicted metal-dependent hydrolase
MSDSAFDYQLRVSRRSRNVQLRVTVEEGLVVVVPRRFDTRKIPQILQRSRRWIQAALERVEARRRALAAIPRWQLPSQAALPAVGAIWRVEGLKTAARRVSLREMAEGHLLVRGAIEDETRCRDAFTRWLMREARRCLVPCLDETSRQIGLKHQRVMIRRQATRWASCSGPVA